MSIVNYYDGFNASGTILTDKVGANNGTLQGASLPVIKSNGYLAFTGGNGATVGDRSRVLFTKNSDYDRAVGTPFSLLVRFRSSKADAHFHGLFYNADGTTGDYYCALEGNEKNVCRTYSTNTQNRSVTSSGVVADGKWHTSYVTHDGTSLIVYTLNEILTSSTAQTGNLYSATSKPSLGAAWYQPLTSWRIDLTGDISHFINFNHKLTVNQIKDYECFFEGCL